MRLRLPRSVHHDTSQVARWKRWSIRNAVCRRPSLFFFCGVEHGRMRERPVVLHGESPVFLGGSTAEEYVTMQPLRWSRCGSPLLRVRGRPGDPWRYRLVWRRVATTGADESARTHMYSHELPCVGARKKKSAHTLAHHTRSPLRPLPHGFIARKGALASLTLTEWKGPLDLPCHPNSVPCIYPLEWGQWP